MISLRDKITSSGILFVHLDVCDVTYYGSCRDSLELGVGCRGLAIGLKDFIVFFYVERYSIYYYSVDSIEIALPDDL